MPEHDALTLAVLAIVGFVLGLAAIRVYLAAGRRRAEWQDLAAQCGARLARCAGSWVLPEACRLPLFRLGESQQVPYAISSTYAGHEVVCFDLQYQAGAARNRESYYYLCAMIRMPFPLQVLCVRPEYLGYKLAPILGCEDIQFESVEFNEAFRVECCDRRHAFDVIHPRMMELLLEHRDVAVEVAGDQLLLHIPQSRSVGRLEDCVYDLLDQGVAIVALLPRYLNDRPTLPH